MAAKNKKATFGTYAIALFWLVLVSGVLLAIPYRINSPYQSVSSIVLINPWASLIRNLHYWSSQFFLVFTLLHLYQHFHKKDTIGIKPGVSFRLSMALLILFLAMISGFILKGDVDSEQARQILESLIGKIPYFGEALAYSLMGDPESYLLIYIHHVATFTIFIAIAQFEHSRKVWAPVKELIIATLVVSIFAYLFTAPVHDNITPTVKGPWYFVGFQEILHWLSYPAWVILFIGIILTLLYFSNSGKSKTYFYSKRILLLFTVFYGLLTIVGLFFRGERWQWAFPWEEGYRLEVLYNFKTSRVQFSPDYDLTGAMHSPEVFGRKESCLICHKDTEGFTESHNPEAIGCSSCHGGNPFATAKNQAHYNMDLIPGNLSNSSRTCGTQNCHPEITERVPTGLMATISGMISVNRTVFGEQDDPDLLTHVRDLGHSPADEHLKNLCVRCHLGNPKTEYGPVKEWSRGGGCLACHLNYSEKAAKALKNSRSTFLKVHPSVSLDVGNRHCFGCHNRSGRIATNYEGWHETTLKPGDLNDKHPYRIIEGRRVFEKQPADVHHELGMECIDCHHSYELMGDGESYAHQEDQADVQCADCHFTKPTNTLRSEDLDRESALIASMRFDDISERQFLQTSKFKRPLINTLVQNDSAFLIGKNTKIKYHLSAPARVCTGSEAHKDLSCSSCHTAWASSCIDCHNSYDDQKGGYNLLTGEAIQGTWIEKSGDFTAKLPALGVRETKEGRELVPVIPGMITTIDLPSFTGDKSDSVLFRRLYAPAAPHTTASKGRSCKSCHNAPVALGYGEGELIYSLHSETGKWEFTPDYATHPQDGLPKDAWIPFLGERTDMVSTRKNVSPLSKEVQKQILTVGACLECHEEESKVMQESLYDFKGVLARKTKNCKLPKWE